MAETNDDERNDDESSEGDESNGDDRPSAPNAPKHNGPPSANAMTPEDEKRLADAAEKADRAAAIAAEESEQARGVAGAAPNPSATSRAMPGRRRAEHVGGDREVLDADGNRRAHEGPPRATGAPPARLSAGGRKIYAAGVTPPKPTE